MPHVNPVILEWARTTAGLSVEEAAEALGVASPDRIRAYENGDEPPSRPVLLKMSKQYRRSLLTFYLAAPPPKGDRGQDFRTLPLGRSNSADSLLDALIRDLQGRQNMVSATLLEEEEQKPLPFIGSVRMKQGIEVVRRSIQDVLRFDLTIYRSSKTTEEAFTYLRACAEEVGIFVLLIGNLGSHHTSIPVDVFRGFAIADPIAPFVVINDQDAKTAWSFTLVHELAHLWLGTTGVSGTRGEMAIEQFCNDLAGELLLPALELQELGTLPEMSVEDAVARIATFAKERHVSRQMVAYKLFRLGIIARDLWAALDQRIQEIWLQERARHKERDRSNESGPSYYVVRRHRIGRALLDFASRNVDAGTLSAVKAARVLGVKPRSLYPLLVNMSRPEPESRAGR